MASRGNHLLHADRRFATGGGFVGRLTAPAISRILDRIDKGLERGGIEITMPTGERRRLGYLAAGPDAAVKFNSWRALIRLAASGSVGWYKAWANREWTSPDPVKLFEIFSLNAVSLGDVGRAKGPLRAINAIAHRLRDNRPGKARANIAAHYDLGNDFYAAWLDDTMTYSSARFGEAMERPSDFLAAAQNRKVELLLNRLSLRPGDRLLEIGCGWGSLAIAAARRGVTVVGLTLSIEQKTWAEREAARAGLSSAIDIRLQDYRAIDESFDAVASVEMVEAVGERWWGAYLDAIARNLRPGGRAALQFIAMDHRLFNRYRRNPDFIQTYIFPGGMLLDEPAFAELARVRGLSWQDRDGFALDYARTLQIWRTRYEAALARGALDDFDAAFHDLWRYYLMYCEGGFRGGAIDVAQVTMVKA